MRRNAPFSWISLVLAVLAVAGWALHWHLTINKTNLTRPPDGKVSVVECAAIANGTSMAALQALHGIPAGSDSTGPLDYPLRENPDRSCVVSFDDNNRVSRKSLDLP